MQVPTGPILDFVNELVHESETGRNSNAMEAEGLRWILTRLKEMSVPITVPATDHNTAVLMMMAESFSYIRHQYDVWHFAKSVMKRLFKATNKKAYDGLRSQHIMRG